MFLSRRILLKQSLYLHRFNSTLSILKNSVNLKLESDTSNESILNSITDVLNYQKLNQDQDIKPLFNSILKKAKTLDQKLLKDIVLLDSLSSDLIVELLKTFTKLNETEFIERQTAFIALRKSLYENTSIENALKIIDLTVSSKNYIEHLSKERNSKFLKSFGGGALGIGLVDLGIRSMEFSPTLSIYSMLFAYLFNLSFFGYLAFGSRFSTATTNIQWHDSVSSSYKVLHLDELKMLSKLTELAVELKGEGGYPDDDFATAINDRNLSIVQPETDVLIQEYWLSGGDNFEWVEPDQDPAEMIWKDKFGVEKQYIGNSNSSVQWTKQLIN